MSKTSTVVGHADLPLDAQWAISYCALKLAVSATPVEVVQSGVAWGVVAVVGDDMVMTKYGEKLYWECLKAKAELNEERDAKALVAAGERAGAYLDEIGVTDLATLDGAQWSKFCGLMVATFIRQRNAA